MTESKDSVPSPRRDHDIDAFLRKVAMTRAQPSDGRGRLMFAMDATASRQPTWDRACQIQGEMFSETAALGGLEVQMAFYRGFFEFSATPWITKSADLVRRMTGVYCLGGQTQIAKVLRHAINETKKQKVNALVFVGDCIEERIDDLCALAGELGMLGVPAFIFQEGDRIVATRGFKQIAKLTNGAHCQFDLSSARQLRDLLSAVAVYAAGGRKALKSYSRKTGGEVRLLAQQVR